MPGPLSAIRFVHAAIRRDIDQIDRAAAADTGLDDVAERFSRWRTRLRFHEVAEENVLFPAVGEVVPTMGEVYAFDHRALDVLFDATEVALSAGDPKEVARATATVKGALGIHLDKEEQLLLALCDEHFDVERQGELSGRMAAQTPPEEFEPNVRWMFPLLDDDERAGMTRVWMNAMPPERFAGAKDVIEETLGEAGWAELARRLEI